MSLQRHSSRGESSGRGAIPEGERKKTGRLEAFSDGVFAIAITLLVLTIPVPHDIQQGHTLAGEMSKHGADFVAYGVSFLTILVMWMNHHSIFQYVVRHDRPFIILNGLLLLLVTFVNYPTALVALAAPLSDNDQRFAAGFYSATLVAISVVYNGLWRYGVVSGRLVERPVEPLLARTITRQYVGGLALYVVAFAVAFFSGWASIALNAALAIFFAFTGHFDRGEPAAKPLSVPYSEEEEQP